MKVSRIPTPLPLLLRRGRHQFLPVLTMLASALLAGWLWARNARSAGAIGEAAAVRIAIESKYEGMLEALPRPVSLFDSVKSGQIVARIDTSAAEAELRQLEASTPTDPAKQARIEELKLRIASRDIKSPIDGTVVHISHRPGESAKLAKPILTVAAERSEFIVGYLKPDQSVRPKPGMAVSVRTRGARPTTYRSHVQSVGPQVEAMPPRFLRDSNQTPEWSLPIQVAMPPEAEIKPGELVDLILWPDAR